MISQSDGTGKGGSSHPYPRAKRDGDFEAVYLNGSWFWQCKKSKRFATIVGKKVTYHGLEPKRLI